MSVGDLKVAIVHDELTRRGGAEVVLEEMLRVWPEAHVYALYAGEPKIIVDGRSYQVRTSFLQKWPVWWRRHPARLLPLLAHAAEQFDLAAYDVVISSASGFAKAVVTRVGVPHVCYCHAPTRYLWDAAHEVTAGQGGLKKWVGRPVLHYLRLTDFAVAQRVDKFLVNSAYTGRQVSNYYRRESQVIHPPINTSFYYPGTSAESGYFLVVGRLTPLKHIDMAIKVCAKLQLPLVVAGVGREKRFLQKISGPDTKFVGRVSDEELRDLYRGARALLQPGVEDFGMAAAEALACGTPVIALGQGGVKEIVQHRVTGLLYEQKREEALAEELRQFIAEPHLFKTEVMQQSVLKFSRLRWQEAMRSALATAMLE